MQTRKPETSLSQRVARGGMWVFALRGLEKVLRLVRLVILARLLAPNDFGLFGIALLAMSTLETFSQTGFQAALVQKKENISRYLDTAWTVSIVRGMIIFLLLFFSAPYIAIFFNSPEAASIIKVIGISVFLAGFVNIGVVYFQKELQFNKQFIYRISTTSADFIVVVLAAVLFKNVWALVFGLLAGNLTALIASYLIHPYRPRFIFDLSKAKELFAFGKWVFGSTVLVFLVTQGDDAFVGKVLGAAMLGFYQLAYRISNMPATEITHVVSQVTFPAYAKIQDNVLQLREAYKRVLHLIAFLSFPVAGLILILAPDFTRIFLGEKWMPMVPAMQVLTCAGLLRSLAATTGPLFYASGKPKVDTRWQMIRLMVMAIIIYPVTMKWGILGTSIAVFVGILISTVGFSTQAIRITAWDMTSFGKTILLPLLNGFFLVLSLSFLKAFMQITGIASFIAVIAIGISVYCGVAYVFDRYLHYNMRLLLRDSFMFMRGRSRVDII
jgi:lipopolysaccharide exporter